MRSIALSPQLSAWHNTAARWMIGVLVTALTVGNPRLYAQDSTQPLLGAVKISDTLWIQQTPAGIDYALNDSPREFLPLTAGTTFVAPGYIKLVWKRLNPLAISVSASENESVDPNYAALTQFLDTLAKLPDLISKPQSGNLADCKAISDLNVALSALQSSLNASSPVSGELVTWRQTIGKSPGPGTIGGVQESMATRVEELRKNVRIARTQIQAIAAIAAAPVPAPAAPGAPPSTPPSAGGGSGGSTGSGTSAGIPAGGGRGNKPAGGSGTTTGGPGAGTGQPTAPNQPAVPIPGAQPQGAGAPPQVAVNCADAAVLARLIAITVSVTDVAARIDLLERLAGDLEKLSASLDPFVKGNWIGDSFEFYRTTANPKVIKAITVKAVPVGVRVSSGALVRTLDTDKATSVTFNLRQHSAVVTEVVPGFVVSKVTAPQYETGVVDGKTVVVRAKDKEVSYGGAVLLNTIFGTSQKSYLYPMVQTGVSISPDGPGFLLGLGGRFNGSRALAFSVGGILGWVKDLQTLAPGSPVGSKADIKNDLGYEPTVKWYFSLQYNFTGK